LNAARAGITAPLRRASRALWHELTGSFFALFAFSFSLGVWHSRANALSSLPADRHRFYGVCALALLFGYFAVSSFVRARRVNR
jgi:Na+-transporting NADH:ubiquinone oxidoreductase subunit NqrB